MKNQTVLVAGGTGFVGSALCRKLLADGRSITIATRSSQPSQPNCRYLIWAPEDIASAATILTQQIEGTSAVVNLAGESVVSARWSESVKRRILESRINATRAIVNAIAKAAKKPAVLINASAIGFYGVRADSPAAETAPAGEGFLANVCRLWETEAAKAEAFGVRVVRLRIGLVLGPEGGALAKMLPPFRLGLGGPLGSGQQPVSWIHRDDLASLIVWLMDNPKASGAFNAVAPGPVTNEEFSRALAATLGKGCRFRVPALALKFGLGEMSSMLLEGQNAVPKAALDLGFQFQHPNLGAALRHLLGR
ncbi:MAG: TIGR01777 family protein [Elusimicrobia bacterium]|nr:TIGR01777 family protein [Elusimicrobiota bacterium]